MLLFLTERFLPLRRPSYSLGHRLLINAALSVLTFSVAAVLVRPISITILQWSGERSFGIVPWLGLSPLASGLATFLLMDATFYYWHRLNHQVPFLWRFHNVHHFDPDLDASTGFRFHFGEVALSSIFRVVQVGLIGPTLPAFMIYEFVFQVETYFHHSNVRLPLFLERVINFLLVSPRMHGIHHSQFHDETDSNYSVIFSLWDRMHGTYRWNIPQSEIMVGVPAYLSSENNLWNVISAPFRSQRNYWLGKETRKLQVGD